MANKKRLIDVNKVIRAMQACIDESPDKKYSVAYFAFESIIECLKQEPTVDAVEVVHGRWIHDQVEVSSPFVDSLPIWADVMQCSVCNEYIEGSHGSNYCPNCGAKMDGGNEDGGNKP